MTVCSDSRGVAPSHVVGPRSGPGRAVVELAPRRAGVRPGSHHRARRRVPPPQQVRHRPRAIGGHGAGDVAQPVAPRSQPHRVHTDARRLDHRPRRPRAGPRLVVARVGRPPGGRGRARARRAGGAPDAHQAGQRGRELGRAEPPAGVRDAAGGEVRGQRLGPFELPQRDVPVGGHEHSLFVRCQGERHLGLLGPRRSRPAERRISFGQHRRRLRLRRACEWHSGLLG